MQSEVIKEPGPSQAGWAAGERGAFKSIVPLEHSAWIHRVSLIGLAAVACFAGFAAPNGWLTAFAIVTIPVLFILTWREREAPALFFACAMQWLQASAAVFYTDYHGAPLLAASGSQDFVDATWLSLISVIILASGMRLALLRAPRHRAFHVRAEATTLSPRRLLALYLVAFAVFGVTRSFAFAFSALTQVLVATSSLKWVFVFMLAYAIIEQRRHYSYLALVVLLEFTIGVLGYFSAFKGVFFVLLVAILGTTGAFRPRRLILTATVALTLFASGIIWTAVKVEYREFISDDSGQQVVIVPVEQRVDKLSDLVSGLTFTNIEEGLESMILRVSYVNYFALSLSNVPDAIPHENGALWFGALKHIAMPRFLFPGKAAIHDSERTEYYTGIRVAGEEQGTSISIGYVGESYIDFGRVGMFAPILLLGAFFGLLYRGFVYHSRSGFLGMAAAASILIFGAYNLETSNIKVVGGNVMVLIVTTLFIRLLGPSIMNYASQVRWKSR